MASVITKLSDLFVSENPIQTPFPSLEFGINEVNDFGQKSLVELGRVHRSAKIVLETTRPGRLFRVDRALLVLFEKNRYSLSKIIVSLITRIEY